jgi:hypothetical protein
VVSRSIRKGEREANCTVFQYLTYHVIVVVRVNYHDFPKLFP